MLKSNFNIFGSCLLATILGIYAQDITLLIHHHLVKIDLRIGVSIVTIISVLMYVCSLLMTYHAMKRKLITNKNTINIYYITVGGIAFVISLWSLFVLSMWWS